MWAWLRRYLNLRQIALLVITVLVGPFWVLNYESVLQAIGLHDVLVDPEGRFVTAFQSIIAFVQNCLAKGLLIGALTIAFLPVLGRVLLRIYHHGQSTWLTFLQHWRGPIYNRSRRVEIGKEALALSQDIIAFILDNSPWPNGIRFYDRSGITSPKPNADTLEEIWKKIDESRKYHAELTNKLISRFAMRIGRVENELKRLGYLGDWESYAIEPLMMEAIAQHMGALAYRLLEDNGIDPKSLQSYSDRFAPEH